MNLANAQLGTLPFPPGNASAIQSESLCAPRTIPRTLSPHKRTQESTPFVPISPGHSRRSISGLADRLERETDKGERLEDFLKPATGESLRFGSRLSDHSSYFPISQLRRRPEGCSSSFAGKDASVRRKKVSDLSSCSICAGLRIRCREVPGPLRNNSSRLLRELTGCGNRIHRGSSASGRTFKFLDKLIGKTLAQNHRLQRQPRR